MAAKDSVDLAADGKVYKTGAFKGPVVLSSDNSISSSFTTAGKLVYASGSNKIVAVYRDSSDQLTFIIGSVDTNSGAVTWGAEVTDSETAGTGIIQLIDYTGVSSDTVVCLYKSATNTLKAIVGDISGSTISLGSAVSIETDNDTQYAFARSSARACADTGSSKLIVATSKSSSTYEIRTYVGTVTGTAISFGSKNSLDTASTASVEAYEINEIYYDSTSDKTVLLYDKWDNSTKEINGAIGS